MEDPTETGDESIGRPGPWGAGRYERGKDVGQSVEPPRPSGDLPAPELPEDRVSTPVTQDEYVTPPPPSARP